MPRFPDNLLPPDFLLRHHLVHRLYVGPILALTPPHPWAPMTDHEWEFLRRLLPPGPDQGLAGRPIRGDIWATTTRPGIDPARARLDAIFRAVMVKRDTRKGPGRATWKDAAADAAAGKDAAAAAGTDAAAAAGPRPDTVRRTFRRLAEAGFFHRLLRAVADLARRGGRGRSEHARPGGFLLGLRYRACCAFRRIGVKRLGLAGLALARRLSLYSALPAHSPFLPDRDLSALYKPVLWRAMIGLVATAGELDRAARRGLFRAMRSMHAICRGRARITRDMEPA